MHKTILTLAAALAALTVFAAPAGAATPFTAGQGNGARIAADPDGNGHVVWGIPSRGGQPAKVGYCRIPAGGSACNVTKEFAFYSPPGQVAQADPLDVTVHAPRPMEVLIFASCTSCGDGGPVDHVYGWQSTTSGVNWAPPSFTVAAPTGESGLLGTTPTAAGLQNGALWLVGHQPLRSRPARATRRSCSRSRAWPRTASRRWALVTSTPRASRTLLSKEAFNRSSSTPRATATRSSTRSTVPERWTARR